ncbi:tRNA (adenosine(37)-N6)-threonylcarbamoyltransferase complex ATPase subunit type 1 TsaE [methane-oxidizing endosymbiont of Gigantopelta aegis]|uniref:tRNA (adenosine(37)-N6)-threonylcarbamoyltransferase complex ATPase subunit type 1 TsaE n=1 Tax=methane-oxidizing endosymbiont of Gigantopelta aegis TaxID=2794938 RepID=UPI0018DB325D|nr:tRNA (adenosine(37)-N6)-threonylcarbamoyltransferase complex ATPase subunit type 1 TsaE [methane-oxidizing endosymbiont of Gigantopelta aegis]
MTQISLANAKATERLGAILWQVLPPSCLVFLYGDLGAGKTTLVRGLLRAAGYHGTVKSPTYTLVEEYRLAQRTVYHFDLYRLTDPEELEWIGMDDYLRDNSLCLIEWPQMGQGFLPAADVIIRLEIDKQQRQAVLESGSEDFENRFLLNWKNKDILL